jgi:hypothetical protein
MGKTNNSTIKFKDVIDLGGLRTVSLSDLTENQLIKDIDITKGRKNTSAGLLLAGPLFHNVTLKNEYGDNHLTKFQDLDIAETYPITLHVTLPTTAWTGYTLYGFTASITYPNGSVRQKSINITETTTDTSIEIENCIDNARVKALPPLLNNTSGATISGTLVVKSDADVEISPLFTEGDGVVCTGPLGYPCFELTRSFDPIGPVIPPVTGDTGTPITTRKIDVYINTENIGLYRLLIQTATYGTGTTLSEVQDHKNLLHAQIPELSKEISGLSMSSTAVQATIEVPSNAYVAIYLSDPSGSASNNLTMSLYSWKEDNHQYVSPGYTRASVTYTINTYQTKE